jgi:hypothetical protein
MRAADSVAGRAARVLVAQQRHEEVLTHAAQLSWKHRTTIILAALIGLIGGFLISNLQAWISKTQSAVPVSRQSAKSVAP